MGVSHEEGDAVNGTGVRFSSRSRIAYSRGYPFVLVVSTHS
jgi:hypothetical protein